MLAAGYSIGTWPIRQLYRQVFRKVNKSGNNIDAVKIWLKLYYEIEPVSIPRVFPDDRVLALKKLVSLIRTLQSIESPVIPEDVKDVLQYVRGYLSQRLCRDTEKCFGSDTEIAKFEKEQFQKVFDHCEESFDDRGRYVQDVKVLLGWAGVFEVSDEDL
jgi:hypothetical protein